MVERRCEYCGTGIFTMRSDARFCSPTHRVYQSRKQHIRHKLPAKLTEKKRFLRFSSTKVPLSVTGRAGSSTNPSTWSMYEEALSSTVGAGMGFVLNGDGIGVIDLDHCIENERVAPWAQTIIDANAGTFMETSISGTGVHIWGLLNSRPGRVIRDERSIEIYTTGRYIALGIPIAGTSESLLPLVIPSD